MTEHFANEAQTILTAELAKGGTTLTVASAAKFPAEGNFRIRIDSELLLVTAVEGTTFTVERGIEETTDFAHADGSTVTQLLTAGGLATKADLEEGALREAELPSSVLLDSQAPAIYASRYGVAASNTGEENSEALAAAIAAAEEQAISRILLPSGTIALKSGFLLNKTDDESGTFQYIVQGDGRGTILDLEKELDWLFRVNCTKEDKAAHATANLVGRLQLRDLMIRGTKGGTTGLVRIINASAQLHNVRGKDLDYGVYQVEGYCDHHSFEDVRWASESTENGWLLYVNGNGDGHSFKRCSIGLSKAAHFQATGGATIDDCVGGIWELQACTGIEFRGHHLDPSLFGEEISAPMIKIEDSRVRIAGGFLLAGASQPIVEVEDNDIYDATQLIVDGTSFGWRNGDPEVSPPRAAHIHIAEAASMRARFIFHYPRGFCVNEGSATSDPVGVLVTSNDEGIQAAIDAAPEQVNGHAVLAPENNNEWKLRPVSRVRTAKRWPYTPAVYAIGTQLEVGGKIAKETKYFYRVAVWDGFQWSMRSKEESEEAEADETAFMVWVNTRSVNVKVRLWRGSTEGEYDRYIDLTIPTLVTRLCDVGDYIAGLSWIVPEKAEEVPTPPENNAQQDLLEAAGHRLLWGSAAPTKGEWNRGDRALHTEPSAGGNEGWVCVESGEPGTWKKFGTISE